MMVSWLGIAGQLSQVLVPWLHPVACRCVRELPRAAPQELTALELPGRQLERCGPEQLRAPPPTPAVGDFGFAALVAALLAGVLLGALGASLLPRLRAPCEKRSPAPSLARSAGAVTPSALRALRN